MVKNNFAKAFRDRKDPWLALLQYGNMPTEGVMSSPAQRLMSRRTKMLVPVSETFLYSQVVKGVSRKITIKGQRPKGYYDARTKVLAEFEVGREVRVVPEEEVTSGMLERVLRNFQIGHTSFKLVNKFLYKCRVSREVT